MTGILIATAAAIVGVWIVAPLLTGRRLRSQAGSGLSGRPIYDWIRGP